MVQPRDGERVFPAGNRIVAARAVLETRRRGNGGDDPGYTIHDARRTMAMRLGEWGINPLVVELLLGHALPKVLATYNIATYEAERIAAAEKWAAKITRLTAAAPVRRARNPGRVMVEDRP